MLSKKNYPTNNNVDFEDLMDFVQVALPSEHQEGCAYGQNDGYSGKIMDCHCSKGHIISFLRSVDGQRNN